MEQVNSAMAKSTQPVKLSSRKRPLDDSCLDHSYGTPPKKLCFHKAVPDLGCVIDCTPPKESQVCTSTISTPAVLDGTKAIRSQNKGTVNSQLPFEHVGSGPSVESFAQKERVTKQCRLKSTPKISAPVTENPPLVINPAFDLDVVDILCLSPIRTSSPEGIFDLLDCRWPSSSMLQNESDVIPHQTQGQAVGGNENEESREKELKKGADVNVNEKDDSGYFSTSYQQVKSVVVVPTGRALSSNKAVPPQPQQRQLKPSQETVKSNRTGRTQREGRERNRERRKLRPVVFAKEEDWFREKNKYVHSVMQHMKEGSDNKDVMTELVNLMTSVADQGADATGVHWQHPSDLTCRNYKRRFGNRPTMSLMEWKNHNQRNHSRFSKIPKIFERSEVN